MARGSFRRSEQIDSQIEDAYSRGISMARIARSLGCHEDSVRRALWSRGVQTRRGRPKGALNRKTLAKRGAMA